MYDWKCQDARATVSELSVLVAHSDDDRFEKSIGDSMMLMEFLLLHYPKKKVGTIRWQRKKKFEDS